MEKISVLLVDDHRMLRESWTGIINSDHRFQVVGDTGNGAEALEMAKRLKPAVVLVDIYMSPMEGYELTRRILQGGNATRVIGLSINNSVASVKRLMVIGAKGYLTKNSSKEEMIKAIAEVNKGRIYICSEIKNILSLQELEDDTHFPLVSQLSERETEVVHHVKKGYTSREIALQLNIGWKTVEAHRYNILRKLHLKNTASLINYFNANAE